MNNPQNKVSVVRIYLTEGQHQLEKLIQLLHDEYKVKGVTAFRGVTGFGQSGKIHSSSLLDISLDLPVVLEFFDEADKVEVILEELNQLIKPGHMINWPATVNC